VEAITVFKGEVQLQEDMYIYATFKTSLGTDDAEFLFGDQDATVGTILLAAAGTAACFTTRACTCICYWLHGDASVVSLMSRAAPDVLHVTPPACPPPPTDPAAISPTVAAASAPTCMKKPLSDSAPCAELCCAALR
jgi:hypothetical protein